MTWFWIALICPTLWALVNHVDKFTISHFFRGSGVGSLVLFTSLSSVVFSVAIGVFKHHEIWIGTNGAWELVLNGVLLTASVIPFLSALEIGEASITSSLFQLIPVIGYVLAWVFLGEKLRGSQLAGSALVVIGAFLVSLDFSSGLKIQWKVLGMMVLASFMVAASGLVFKAVALNASFWGAAFWECIGSGAFGVAIFAFMPLYRRQFIATLRAGGPAVVGINLLSESLNMLAKLASNYASLLAPIAMVWVVNGLQPLIAFFMGAIFSRISPSLCQEDLRPKTVAYKLAAMVLIFGGGYWLLK